jgi:hypothetical protein
MIQEVTDMRFAARLILFGVMIASSASAVDGVLELNQACASGPGCFAGDTADFPVQITTAGSYRLTGNLVVASPNTTAILVTSAQVSIDLNGFAIVGPNVCSGCPVTSCTATGSGNGIDGNVVNLAIRNGTIRGMGASGVRGRGLIEHVILDQNGDRGVFATSGVTVKDSTVSSNGGIGITSGGGIMSGNMVACNGSTGMELFAGSMIGNHAVQNGGDGINVTAEGVVLNNNANNNGLCGIRVSRGQVTSNTVDFNQTCGITVSTSGGVIGNTLDGNGASSSLGKALNLASSVGFADNVLRNHGSTPWCSAVTGGREMGQNVCDSAVSCTLAYCPFFDPLCGPCIP